MTLQTCAEEKCGLYMPPACRQAGMWLGTVAYCMLQCEPRHGPFLAIFKTLNCYMTLGFVQL